MSKTFCVIFLVAGINAPKLAVGPPLRSPRLERVQAGLSVTPPTHPRSMNIMHQASNKLHEWKTERTSHYFF